MIAEHEIEENQIHSLVITLLEAINYQLPDDGAPQIVLNTQISDIHCSLICTRIQAQDVRLSTREKEIATLIIRGLPNKTIAHQLEIKPSTVAVYVKRMFLKLHVNTRAEMVAKIFQSHLL